MPARPRTFLAIAFLAAVAVIAALSFVYRSAGPHAAATATSRPTNPDPALTPVEVVAAVLAALKNNDPATDDGLRTTFRFASPANQRVTGPVDRFVAMVKKAPYANLINHRAARVKPIEMDDARAVCLVRVVATDGHRTYFLWNLSKQSTDGPLNNCWLTDAVSPIEPPPGEEPPEERI
jgi:hypothetical protein